MIFRYALLIGAILAGLSVALGAFGAHGLTSYFEGKGISGEEQQRRLDNWEVAARYQMYHALALMVIGILGRGLPSSTGLEIAAACFVVGVAVFSGCLYVLVLTGIKVLGAIVPLGGAAFLCGWIALVATLLRR